MRSVFLVALTACWWNSVSPSAPVKPAPPSTQVPDVCPLVLRQAAFEFVRHELFAGCSPPQFAEAMEVRCNGACATPCGATLDASPNAGFTKAHARFLIDYDRGRYTGVRKTVDAEPRRTCVYDTRGRMSSCDPGVTQRQHYPRDVEHRLTGIDIGDPTPHTRIEFAYDARGDLAEVRTDNEIARFHYDDARRLISEERFVGTDITAAYAYHYDREGRLRSIGLAEDGDIKYTYDGDRLVMTDENRRTSNVTTRYVYDARVRPLSTTIERVSQPTMKYTFAYRYRCE